MARYADAGQPLAALREQVATQPPESPWHETLRLVEPYLLVQDGPAAAGDVRERMGSRPATDLAAIGLHDLIRERLEATNFDR